MKAQLKTPKLNSDCPTIKQFNKAEDTIRKYETYTKEQALNTLIVCGSCNHEQAIKESTFIVELYYREHDSVDDFGTEYHWTKNRFSSCNKCSALNDLPNKLHNELLFKNLKYLKEGNLCDSNKSY